MIEFSWRIVEMLRADECGHQDVVTLIRFALDGTDTASGARASVSGCLTPPMPRPDAPFTAFADLTEAQVAIWLEAMPIIDHLRAEVVQRIKDRTTNHPVSIAQEKRL